MIVAAAVAAFVAATIGIVCGDWVLIGVSCAALAAAVREECRA